MSKTMRTILLAVLVLLVVIQFFRIDKTNPPVEPGRDLLTLTNPPAELAAILKDACYDCHSNETVYPWYSNVAPVSWWLKNHVEEGREHLNFSEWGLYDAKKRAHKAEETTEEVHEGKMPLPSYTWTHAEARLSEAQRQQVADWFKGLMTQIQTDELAPPTGDPPAEPENGQAGETSEQH